jgi:hypothetical protein
MPRRKTRRKIGSVGRASRIERSSRRAARGDTPSCHKRYAVAVSHIDASIAVDIARPAMRSAYDELTCWSTSKATDLCSSSSAACQYRSWRIAGWACSRGMSAAAPAAMIAV